MYFMCTYNKCIHKMITNIDIEEIKDNISEIIIDLSYNIDYTKYHEAKFDEYVFDTVYQHFVEHIDEEDFSEIYNDNIDEIYHKVGCQKRSFIHDHVIDEINQSTKEKLERYQSQINYLMNVPQPEQRTPEWYEFRYNHITGSNAWKIFSTDSARRQLYYEKLVPQDVKSSGGYSSNNLSDNPMNWGHKYEPLTTQFYEYYNDVKVGEFGCIPHKDIPFLAASPDGIVIEGPLIGRMLEIKNVVSREITGIPKMDYYVQMQIQMEVCDLDECDFVETKFTEFDSYQDFMDDEEFVKKGNSLLYPHLGKTINSPLKTLPTFKILFLFSKELFPTFLSFPKIGDGLFFFACQICRVTEIPAKIGERLSNRSWMRGLCRSLENGGQSIMSLRTDFQLFALPPLLAENAGILPLQ